MSSGSKSGRNEPATTDNNHISSITSSSQTTTTTEDQDNSEQLISSNNLPANLDKLVIQSDLSCWPSSNKQNKDDNNCKQPNNNLDTQQQRLNLLVELISSQEAKLNRLKALRKLAKEQAAINVELNNELKTVNNSITEKDGELRQALNRVDNLNRQLNNYRRTRTHRAGKASLTPTKPDQQQQQQPLQDQQSTIASAITIDGGSHTEDSISTTQDLTRSSSASSEIINSDACGVADTAEATSTKESPSSLNSDSQDLTRPSKLVNALDKDESKLVQNSIHNNSPAIDGTKQNVHNHASPALTKYTNARQKLIGSGFKDKSNGRRVSFDPLALLLDAALEGELDLVIQTSKQVPDLSASHDECVTALHNAVVAGHYEVAKFLIEAGCDINTQDSDGWTPLHCAASCNNLALVKLLVENGALIYATTTSDHSTPAMKCERNEEGFEECYKYLMYLQNNLGVMNNGLVYALYDYEAQQPDELSFKTDDELIIVQRDDSQEQEWWVAQKRIKETSDNVASAAADSEQQKGYIPRNLVGLYPRVKSFKRNRISESASVSNNNGNGSSE